MTIGARFDRMWRSVRGMPLWVLVWVAILAATNTVSFFVTDTPTGTWAGIAFAAIIVMNGAIFWVQAGLTRLLSFPHFVWVPLVIWLVYRLWFGGEPAPSGFERSYAIALVVINGISLAFDSLDGWRWLKGGREILGIARSEDRAA